MFFFVCFFALSITAKRLIHRHLIRGFANSSLRRIGGRLREATYVNPEEIKGALRIVLVFQRLSRPRYKRFSQWICSYAPHTKGRNWDCVTKTPCSEVTDLPAKLSHQCQELSKESLKSGYLKQNYLLGQAFLNRSELLYIALTRCQRRSWVGFFSSLWFLQALLS